MSDLHICKHYNGPPGMRCAECYKDERDEARAELAKGRQTRWEAERRLEQADAWEEVHGHICCGRPTKHAPNTGIGYVTGAYDKVVAERDALRRAVEAHNLTCRACQEAFDELRIFAPPLDFLIPLPAADAPEPKAGCDDCEFLMQSLVDQEAVLDEALSLLRQANDDTGVDVGYDDRLAALDGKVKALADWRSRSLRLAATGQGAKP